LTPFNSYEQELKSKFEVKLENTHIINPKEQLYAAIVPRGVSGKRFNFSYQNRDDEDLIADLGNTLVNVARLVPNGLLVFFPSYAMMKKFINKWATRGILARMEDLKEIMQEVPSPH
jgi:regulator of telomere elongation helicase 1